MNRQYFEALWSGKKVLTAPVVSCFPDLKFQLHVITVYHKNTIVTKFHMQYAIVKANLSYTKPKAHISCVINA